MVTQDEIDELTAVFKAVFENMIGSVVVYDLNGKIVQVNTAAQRLFDMPAEDLIGKDYHQLDACLNNCGKQHQPVLGEQSIISHILHNELRMQSPPVEMLLHLPSRHDVMVSVTNIPVYDQRGRVCGCASIVHDRSELQQSESRLLQSFTALLTLVETLATFPESSEIGETGSISPITSVGKSLAKVILDVLGCRYVDVFTVEPPDDRQHLIGVSGLTPAQEQQLKAEVEHTPLIEYIDAAVIAQLHANQIITLDLQQTPYVKAHSAFGARYRLLAPMVLHEQLIGIFIIAKTDVFFKDVTSAFAPEEVALARGVAKLIALVIERVRLLQGWAEAQASELALREANRRYDTLLSIACHELRTPLTTIKGNVELALRRLEACQRQVETGSLLNEQLERVHKPLVHAVQRTNIQARMIREFLDSSNIQTHKFKIDRQSCNLREIVINTVEGIQLTTTDRMIVLHLPEERCIPICADADRISQVIDNFMSNAMKYSQIVQPVNVNLAQEGSFARVSVQDRGPGLSLEEQKRIWERFYQVPGVEIQYGGGINGLGLGLFVSRTIVKQHHGQIGVDSTPGEGSTFWFTLPIEKHGIEKKHKSVQ